MIFISLANIAQFTLDISLFLYCIQFLPQLYHNVVNPQLQNISLMSQYLYFLGIGLDLIYGLGFQYPWQYILVDILYLFFLLVQEYQIINAKRFSVWWQYCPHVFVILWIGLVFVSSLYLWETGYKTKGFHIGSHNDAIFWFSGIVSSVIWIVMWFPQIIKNILQKRADGYVSVFWIIGLVMVLCDITSALILHYKWMNIATSSFRLIIHLILLSQVYIYRQRGIRTTEKVAK